VKIYKIACIPGDGIGKEVVPAGQQVLQALAATQNSFKFEFTSFGWGGDWFRKHGVMMPENGLDELRDKDAIGWRPAHSRPHHAVGPATENLPGLRPIRQRAPDTHPARH
jgi:isocitrate/isopropylmalate dehydrogenase